MLFAIQGIIGLAKEGFKTPMGLLFSFSRLKPRLKARLRRHFSPNQKSSCFMLLKISGNIQVTCIRYLVYPPLPASIIRQELADYPTALYFNSTDPIVILSLCQF